MLLEDISKYFTKFWSDHFHENIVGVSWDRWELPELIEMAQLAAILRRFCLDFAHVGSGLVCFLRPIKTSFIKNLLLFFTARFIFMESG